MKTKSKFKALPPEDQDRIFQLCNDNSFDKAVEIVERPRPEGFGLKTSYSALRRFYLQYNPHVQAAQVLGQYAHGLRIQHQAAKGSYNSAILLHVESRVLESLKQGKAIADLQSEIKTMINVQKAFVAVENWRKDSGQFASADHRALLDDCAREGKEDFKPAIPGDNIPFVEEPYSRFSPEDIARIDDAIAENDIAQLSHLHKVEGFPMALIHHRRELYIKNFNSERGVRPSSAAATIQGPHAPNNSANRPSTANQPALSADSHTKTPVKPHYPLKATSSENGARPSSAAATMDSRTALSSQANPPVHQSGTPLPDSQLEPNNTISFPNPVTAILNSLPEIKVAESSSLKNSAISRILTLLPKQNPAELPLHRPFTGPRASSV
jgi:hypothetical protein